MIVTQQAEEPERRKSASCYGCNGSFSVPESKWNPAADQFCPACEHKRIKLAVLRSQLVLAQQFGHTMNGCELCAIQNQIDDLLTGGYDWREKYEQILDNLSNKGDRL